MPVIRPVLSCALVLLSLLPGAAQTAAPQQEPSPELEKKALDLLEAALSEAQSLRLAENRLRVQATAAYLLWPRDEKRARALFAEAQNAISRMMSGVDDGEDYYSAANAPARLRHEILEMLAPLDPVLALEFLRATRQPPRPPHPRYGMDDPELRMELLLAVRIAERDPQLALQLGEEALKRGLSYDALHLLEKLHQKDGKAAAKLAELIMEKLRAADLADHGAALPMLFEMLRLAARPPAPGAPASEGGRKLLSEADFLRLLDMVLAAATRLANAPAADPRGQERHAHLARLLYAALPEAEKYAPGRAAALRRRLADYEQANPYAAQRRQVMEFYARRDMPVDDILKVAGQAPPPERPGYYHRAAVRASESGDADRARQIVNEHIPYARARADLLASIDEGAAARLAEQGKLDEALQMALQIPSKSRRAGVLLRLAGVVGQKDPQEQRRFFDLARAQLGDRAEDYEDLRLRMDLARAYATVEPAQSLALIESSFDQFNELMAAAAGLSGFENNYFSEGEMRMAGGNLPVWVSQFTQLLPAVARADFDRAGAAAARLQRTEARALARLAVARAVLDRQPTP